MLLASNNSALHAGRRRTELLVQVSNASGNNLLMKTLGRCRPGSYPVPVARGRSCLPPSNCKMAEAAGARTQNRLHLLIPRLSFSLLCLFPFFLLSSSSAVSSGHPSFSCSASSSRYEYVRPTAGARHNMVEGSSHHGKLVPIHHPRLALRPFSGPSTCASRSARCHRRRTRLIAKPTEGDESIGHQRLAYLVSMSVLSPPFHNTLPEAADSPPTDLEKSLPVRVMLDPAQNSTSNGAPQPLWRQ